MRIGKAAALRDPWAVLEIPPGSSFNVIKSARRQWIRRLHPDRWYCNTDERLRAEIQEAFYQVQAAYFDALTQCAAALDGSGIRQEPITPPPAQSEFSRRPTWFQRLWAYFFRSQTVHC